MSLVLASSVSASTFEATNNLITTKICIAAAEGNKARLNRIINQSGLSRAYITNKVKCNDIDITAFVNKYGKSPKLINDLLSKYKKPPRNNQIGLVKL